MVNFEENKTKHYQNSLIHLILISENQKFAVLKLSHLNRFECKLYMYIISIFLLFFIFPSLCPFSKIRFEELQNVRESESRYKQQHIEVLKREKMLIRRLAAKEQEMQEYVVLLYILYIKK